MTMLMTPKDVADLLAVSAATVRKMVERGELPNPVYLGPRLPRWQKRVIENWLADRFEDQPECEDPDAALDRAHESRKASSG